MPRVAAVSSADLLSALLAQKDILVEGRIPGPHKQIWKVVSAHFNGLISPANAYQRVWENRDNLYDKIREHFGLPTLKPEPEANLPFVSDGKSLTSTSSGIWTVIQRPKKTFLVNISWEEWQSIKPVKTQYRRKERNTLRPIYVLPPYKWEDVLIAKLWTQHKLPCPYSFKKSTVSIDSSLREQYIKLYAQCNECGNIGEGILLNEPTEDEPLQLEWRATDTTNCPHKKKRHLSRDTKFSVGKELINSSAAVYRRLRADQLMDSTDVEPPQLYKNDALRRAKQHTKEISSNVIHGPDPIMCLEIMKHQQPHCGSIHDIGQDKFFVHYYTPSQLFLYKKLCASEYVVLAFDATGSIAQKIVRLHGSSQHIYLYQGVLVTRHLSVSCVQMLSEKQDANSILYFLNEWERNGAPCPKEVVIDDSPALKSAFSRSFGRSADINEYKEKCFLFLSEDIRDLPPCYIRLDVAHLIKDGRWKVLQGKRMSRQRDFFLRCLGLLIKAEDLSVFEAILLHVLTLALSKSEGHDVNGKKLPMEESLHFLSASMASANLPPEIQRSEEDEDLAENSEDEPEAEGFASAYTNLRSEGSGRIEQWIQSVKSEAIARSSAYAERINPFYSEEVAHKFIQLAKSFTLWSAVMIGAFKSPYLTASSSYVESDFNDLKNRILKGDETPLLVHKLVDRHLASIQGEIKLAGAQFKSFSQSKADPEDDVQRAEPVSETPILCTVQPFKECAEFMGTDGRVCKEEIVTDGEDSPWSETEQEREREEEKAPNDLNCYENWRGKIGGRKGSPRKPSKYLTPCPDASAVASLIEDRLTKKKKGDLLQNGSRSPYVAMSAGSVVKINNTCAFDVIVSVIANGYLENRGYRQFVDDSGNRLLKTARSFALNGAVPDTYKLRAEALCAILSPISTLPMPKVERKPKKPSIIALEYDSFGNVVTLAKNLLADVPSLELTVQCDNAECQAEKVFRHSVLNKSVHVICSKGLSALSEAVCKHIRVLPKGIKLMPKEVTSRCPQPCTAPTKVCADARHHVLIDTDYLGTKLPLYSQDEFNRPVQLNDIPRKLRIADVDYNLVGMVAYKPRHYVAYTWRRLSETWDLHDDLSRKCLTNVSRKEEILPHLLMYN